MKDKNKDRENLFGDLIGNLRELPEEDRKRFLEKLKETVNNPQKPQEINKEEMEKIDESVETIQKRNNAKKHIDKIKKILNPPKS